MNRTKERWLKWLGTMLLVVAAMCFAPRAAMAAVTQTVKVPYPVVGEEMSKKGDMKAPSYIKEILQTTPLQATTTAWLDADGLLVDNYSTFKSTTYKLHLVMRPDPGYSESQLKACNWEVEFSNTKYNKKRTIQVPASQVDVSTGNVIFDVSLIPASVWDEILINYPTKLSFQDGDLADREILPKYDALFPVDKLEWGYYENDAARKNYHEHKAGGLKGGQYYTLTLDLKLFERVAIDWEKVDEIKTNEECFSEGMYWEWEGNSSKDKVSLHIYSIPVVKPVTKMKISGIKAPVVGGKPVTTGITASSPDSNPLNPLVTDVLESDVKWEGKLDDISGTFLPGQHYTISIPYTVFDGTYTPDALYSCTGIDKGNYTVNAGTVESSSYDKENMVGTVKIGFDVPAIALNSSDTSISVSEQTYTGSVLTPEPVVTYKSKQLVKGTDYTISYESNTNAGMGIVNVTGKGQFKGTKSAKFKVNPASLTAAAVTAADQTYTGKALTPAATVKLGGKTLKADTDYTLAYAANTNEGTATITVTGKDNYTGTAKGSFKITKKAEATKPDGGTGSSSGDNGSSTGGSGSSSGDNGSSTGGSGISAKAGTTLTDTTSQGTYKVTKAGASGKAEVQYTAPTKKTSTKVVIPATVTVNGVKYKVTTISAKAFKNNKKIKSVVIGKYVTTIGTSAFYGCTKLTSVTMGASVKTIGSTAFAKCTALKSIVIPSKVTKIGKKAFYGDKKLKSIQFKTKSLTASTIGAKAFTGIAAKATFKLPKAKLKDYKAILLKKGAKKTMKFTK